MASHWWDPEKLWVHRYYSLLCIFLCFQAECSIFILQNRWERENCKFFFLLCPPQFFPLLLLPLLCWDCFRETAREKGQVDSRCLHYILVFYHFGFWWNSEHRCPRSWKGEKGRKPKTPIKGGEYDCFLQSFNSFGFTGWFFCSCKAFLHPLQHLFVPIHPLLNFISVSFCYFL